MPNYLRTDAFASYISKIPTSVKQIMLKHVLPDRIFEGGMIVYIGYNTFRGNVYSKYTIPDTKFALLQLVTKFVNFYR